MAKIVGYRESSTMYYSCFDPRTGTYEYFTDGESGTPINGDLPVPKLPAETKLGVAAIEAGRPLPSGVKRMGRGLQARGQIVQCGKGFNGLGSSPDGLGSLQDLVSWGKSNWTMLAVASAAGAITLFYLRRV